MKIIYTVIMIAASVIMLTACDQAEDEAKKLGFKDAKDMIFIQSKGWHTKEKYYEDNYKVNGFENAAAMKNSLIDTANNIVKNTEPAKIAVNGSDSEYRTGLTAEQKKGVEYAAKIKNIAREAAVKAEASKTYKPPVNTEKYTVFFVCEDQYRAGRDESLADLLLGEAEGDGRMFAARLNSLREYCRPTYSRITDQEVVNKLGYGGISNRLFKYKISPGVTMGVRRE